jgi:hypothetical protein
MALSWREFRNGTRHLRADCRRCGAFCHYVEQTPANVEAAEVQSQATVDLPLAVRARRLQELLAASGAGVFLGTELEER